MPEITLTCMDCGKEFAFTESEQDFYREKGFEHEPKRCGDCRKKRKDSKRGTSRGRGGHQRSERQSFEVVCSACGISTNVPFKPKEGTPVYCRPCFEKQKSR